MFPLNVIFLGEGSELRFRTPRMRLYMPTLLWETATTKWSKIYKDRFI